MEIQDRTFKLGVKIAEFAIALYKKQELQVLLKQLLRSGTSIGANMEEADGAVSKKDFINKVSISFKEAKETRYWLRILQEAELLKNQENLNKLLNLLKETEEIANVLGAILKKAKA
ncbi:MAG: four helix bundle protein [Candidatus Margulisiibacteriota bacterium]|jgi:four helix bundle protein